MKNIFRIVGKEEGKIISLREGKIIIVKNITRKNKPILHQKRIIVHTFDENIIDKIISSNA